MDPFLGGVCIVRVQFSSASFYEDTHSTESGLHHYDLIKPSLLGGPYSNVVILEIRDSAHEFGGKETLSP